MISSCGVRVIDGTMANGVRSSPVTDVTRLQPVLKARIVANPATQKTNSIEESKLSG